jgi:acetyl esterase
MRRLLAMCVTVVAGVATGVAQTAVPASAQTPLPTAELDVVYRTVDGKKLRADVFLPPEPGDLRPAVLILHGGGWSGGDKRSAAWAGLGLASLGYVAVTVNYRLAPEHPFPAAVRDVQAAVRWMRAPRQRAAYGIDPARIGAAGGSAGGHLAGMLATMGSGSRDRGSRVDVVVSWSGPMDLRKPAARVDRGKDLPDANGVPVFLACERRDCPAERARRASPLHYVDASDAPILMAEAETDLIPLSWVEPMADALADAGVDHDLIILPGGGHSTTLAPQVSRETVAFLDAYLKAPGT